MDRRVLLFAILLPLLGISGQGQIIKDYSDAELEVYYNKHLEMDTTQMGTQLQDTQMSLRIGRGHALFAATRNMWVDSLKVYNNEKYMEL